MTDYSYSPPYTTISNHSEGHHIYILLHPSFPHLSLTIYSRFTHHLLTFYSLSPNFFLVLDTWNMALRFSEFPFNQCDNRHLKDSQKIIFSGIKSSIRDYRKFQDVSRQHSTNKMANETIPEVYENQLEQLHPGVCKNVPGTSILKPASRKPTFTLNLAATKIELLVREIYVDIITDPRFNEIKNFVVNMILQAFSSSSPTSISNKIFSKSYRDTLLGDIDECFQNKYIELKIDEYFDASASFLMYPCDIALDELLSKPKLYERYRCIWKLDNDDYKMFDRKYFIREHFKNTYKSSGSDSRDDLADEYFKIGFLMNLDRFIHYFSKEMKDTSAIFCEETVYDSDLCSISIPYLSSSVETLDTVISDTLDTVSISDTIPKSLRFHEHANIIDINKEEPAFYVNYNIAETISI